MFCVLFWWGVNDNILTLADMESMQFGHALEKILREISTVQSRMKVDISNGFYQIDANVDDVPKLGVFFNGGW